MDADPGTVSPEVLCAGILVADIFVPPLRAVPAAGQLVSTDDFLMDAGGCAANVAACLSRLGAACAATGKVGPDPFGELIRRCLSSRGVDTSGIGTSAATGTSKTVILPVLGEDRRYVHTFGANADFRASDVDLDRFPDALLLYIGGYLAMPGVTEHDLAALLVRARQRGIRTVVDVVVPAGDSGRSAGALAAILPYVDLFLPNEDEARALTGEQDPVRQAGRFLSAGCEAAVITRGSSGALYRSASQCFESNAYAVDVVDGSGAGDAFAAGCILGLLEGWEPERVLRFASALGAGACTRLGCTDGVPRRTEAEAFVREHPLRVSMRKPAD